MKISITKSTLLLRFGGKATVSKTVLLPLSGVAFTLNRDDNGIYSLVADSPIGHTTLMHFENEYDAVRSLRRINGALRRHIWTDKGTCLFRLIFWPLAAVALIVSLNGAMMNLHTAASTPALTLNQPPTVPTQQFTQPASQPQPPAPQLIQALAQAAKSGKFTVSLSQGKPHTLYVFSDPLCPHCRAFEPTLERLTADYNIEVFPVSLVGDDAQIAKSGIINQFVLTADKNERIQRWKKVMIGEVSAANDAPQSQEIAERVNANNQAFGLLGFTGTPSVITEDGKEISLDVVKNPEQLAGYFNN
ncbi:thioredoxin fold domain-containing protein [Escherichia coli]